MTNYQLQRPQEEIERIVALFKEGRTYQEIGGMFDLSRERVRQILLRAGVQSHEGGQALKVKQARDERIRMKAEKHVQRAAQYGLTVDEFNELVTKYGAPSNHANPLYGFFMFRRNATRLYPGVPFNLTFKDWHQAWADSGHDRGDGKFWMVRVDRDLPFERDNMRVAASSEIVKEVRARDRQKD